MLKAALFSGQGSQYAGMGKELYDNFAAVRDIYTAGSDILGFDIAKASFEYDEQELAQTLISQPVIFTLSVAAYTVATEIMGEPDAVAGHSLGEFAALYAAGAYTLEDGFRIIKSRAAAMQQAAATAAGAMYAIVGSNEDAVRAACESIDGFVVPVNFNLPTQTVISGEEAAATAAAEALAAQGAKAVRLGVSSAFHTKMMDSAAKAFAENIAAIKFAPTKIVFYSNLTGRKNNTESYPEYFAKHMVSPVRFVEQMNAMAADGITTCIEFGPKKTAITLAKKNIRAFNVYNIEDKAGIDGLAAFLEKANS